MKTKILILFILITVLGCKEEFLLDSIQDEKVLVVDGFITNEPGPYRIKLSYTSNVSQPEILPVSGCEVTITDNTGNNEILIEKEPGNYYTSESGIIGIIGNQYKLFIVTPEGKEYSSEFQELKAPVEIDSVYARTEFIPDLNYPAGMPGYKFYIDTKSAPTENVFFLWSMTETFEYDIDYKLAYIIGLDGGEVTNTLYYDTIRTCWKTQNVKYIATGTTKNLNAQQIKKQPLFFVNTETKKLTKRYSVLVKQYSIDEETYKYWDGVREQISNDNFLVTNQPYNVKSNIQNIFNHEERVFGFFTVASVTQKRIFVDKIRESFYFQKCFVITDRATISEYRRFHRPPYYYVEVDEGVFGLITYTNCLDCRIEGGTLTKPDFWID